MSSASWLLVRYFAPLLLLPLLAIWLGQLAEAGLCALAGPTRRVAGVTIAAAIAVNLLALGTYSAALRDADIRDQTLVWLMNNVPAKTRIGVVQGFDGDVFSHPPAISHFAWTACPLSSCDLQQFLAQPLDIVIVADTYLQRPAIVGTGLSSTVSAVLAEQSIYLPRRRFAPRWSRFGVDVANQFSAYDLHAALPTLTLYWR